jgi:uncharacterized protein YutE (UPF0331/DUF86 family)
MESALNAIDKIYARMENLREYVSILEGLQDTSLSEFEKDPIKKGALERYLQLAIEACIDIAEILISDQRLRTPQTAREAIEILGEKGILDKSFAREFSKAVGFRNILIHDYVKIDYEIVLKNLKNNRSDFHRFIKEILEFLK